MQEIKLTQGKQESKQYIIGLLFLCLKWGRDQIAGLNKLGGICCPCWRWYDHDQIADIFICGHVDQTIIANTIQGYDHKMFSNRWAMTLYRRGNGCRDQ